MKIKKLYIKYQNYRLKLKNFKLLFVILIFAFYILILPPITFAQSATLSLSPATVTLNRGCSFSLNINLDTGSAQTDGTDAILIYDTSRFSANSIQSGTIYPDYPGNNIDESTGKITVSGLASVSQAFSGKGTLSTINFTVKPQAATGVTQIKFDFDPNDKSKTTDSNVVERGTVADILNSVADGSYTIGTGTCAAPSPGPARGGIGSESTPSASTTPIIYKTLPPGGTPELTATIAILGFGLTILGILGLALL